MLVLGVMILLLMMMIMMIMILLLMMMMMIMILLLMMIMIMINRMGEVLAKSSSMSSQEQSQGIFYALWKEYPQPYYQQEVSVNNLDLSLYFMIIYLLRL